MANKQVFFDVSIGGSQPQRITMELFSKDCPKTAENFATLCTREKPEGFKNSSFHRIIKSTWSFN